MTDQGAIESGTFCACCLISSEKHIIENNLWPCRVKDLITMKNIQSMEVCKDLHVFFRKLLRQHLTGEELEVWDILEEQCRVVVCVCIYAVPFSRGWVPSRS